jgi:nitrate/nitrite transport system ATP-binding protein
MTIAYAPLELSALTKTFQTADGPFTAVKDVTARVQEGEFVCILGHSGCGKSTVLSIIAGLDRATLGGVIIEGREIDGPGPERSVVFQSPNLLPWLTARQNIRIAVDRAAESKSRKERGEIVDRYVALLGLEDAADQLPRELSLGTQQCVAIARALSVQPRFLLLDEPFSMLDSLTRFDLQDTLLKVWEEDPRVVVMVTHDVDEALYVADRLILMTDGPEARVGEILTVPFPRPRRRAGVLQHPEYHACRERVIDFLDHHAHQSRAGRREDATAAV